MKTKITILFALCSSLLAFSQTRILLHGKVLDNEFPLKGVDIINYTTMKTATTDANGKFDIMAKDSDELIFVLKLYEDKKIAVRQKHLDQNNLVINLIKKPTTLKEVKIERGPLIAMPLSVNDVKLAKLEYQKNHPTNPNVYTGEIVNGIDFVAIAKNIARLLKSKKKKPSKASKPIDFKEMINNTVDEAYFVQNLKIMPEQNTLFLEYCEKDPKTKTLIQNQDILEIMDFLLLKSKEFLKEGTAPTAVEDKK